ncbi:MAG: NAD(P)-dependent oxidoreductase [Candidatus Thermoplasmatota archaeon]|jgi:nucleoside-diphosphate-sugar epimerase|nr:NAD(P)-dependent oxidoreductase [Candidatus Thermoplasmatota archaeon]MCL5988012.1 NAD(P)-dependent oxidoreductase [Candidatus Thermoplasmatota archaeon]
MNILVTGSKGFIGTQLMEDLQKAGYAPVGVDIGDKIPEIKFDAILHFGARTLIRNSLNHPYEYFEDGLALTMKCLELARKTDAMFLFPSSGSTAEPSNAYSMSKKHGTEWINLYRNLYGTRATIFRLFNIYGTNARKGAVYLFSKAALTGEKAIRFGDGTHVRDYLNVSDLSKAVIKVVNGKLTPGDYELGTGKGVSVNQLIQMVEQISGKKIEIEEKPFILEEADKLVAKNSPVENPIPLEEGIRNILKKLESELK